MNRLFAIVVLVLLAAAGAYSLLGGRGAADGVERAALEALDARLAALEADVAAMGTYQAIWENELRYTRGLDRHDEALERAVFWPDAAISYGNLVPFEELAAWANRLHAAAAAHQHHVTGLTLDVDGATAHEEGYILYSSDVARDRSLDVEGPPTPGRVAAGSMATLGTGRYVNRYERRGGDWRMIVHEYVHDVSMRLPAVDVCADGCLGRWDASDISYRRPLEPLSADERRARVEQGKTPRGLPNAPRGEP
jgi:type II secretory pathway pseudopilin PulG